MSSWMITDDNSGYYLAHHQRVGAHWGVRLGPPYPLSRTADGRINTKKQAERKRNSTQNRGTKEQNGLFKRSKQESSLDAPKQDNTNIDDVRKAAMVAVDETLRDPAYKKAEDDFAKTIKPLTDYDNLSDEEWFKYADMAGEAAYNRYKDRNPDDDDMDVQTWKDWYRYDDGDQGSDNSCVMYLRDKGIDPYEYGVKTVPEAEKKYTETVRGLLKKHLEDSGYENRPKQYDDQIVEESLSEIKTKSENNLDKSSAWYMLNDAAPGPSSRSATKQTGLFNRQTPEEREAQRITRQDQKWVKRNSDKVYKQTYKKSRKEVDAYVKRELNKQMSMRNANGKVSMSYVNAYNKKLAEVMNKNVGNVEAPSGRVVRFIPKRGEVGVHVALADPAQSMNSFKRGVYGDGRVAYRKNYVNKI